MIKVPKITHKEILTHFIETFYDDDEVLTGSEYRMLSIKLSSLKKTVRKYLEDANISTNKSVEQIILECIDYSAICGKKLKSVSSMGYEVLGKSIKYWEKQEQLEEQKQKEKERKEKESEEEKLIKELQERNNKRRSERKKVPKWFAD